jgi:hypothetical protein
MKEDDQKSDENKARPIGPRLANNGYIWHIQLY